MGIFFTADSHFGHVHILKYDEKTRNIFRDIHEHNEYLIERWNSAINPRDTVYHLGDFALADDPEYYFNRLNGHIHLIKGNHDHRNVLKKVKGFKSVQDVLYLKKENIFLSHYPHFSWPKSGRDCYHLFGHVHERFKYVPGLEIGETYNKNLNVGVMWHNFTPISIDRILK